MTCVAAISNHSDKCIRTFKIIFPCGGGDDAGNFINDIINE